MELPGNTSATINGFPGPFVYDEGLEVDVRRGKFFHVMCIYDLQPYILHITQTHIFYKRGLGEV